MMSDEAIRPTERRAAISFIVLLGLVSLFADITYEGARSITGPFLTTLGASGLAVGVIAGLGEFLGYALRLATGYLADRSRQYWLLTIAGYAINLLAVPLLALAGRWEVAAGLMIAERVGKAVRSPARDAMLSHATQRTGHGWGFGLHEALDQIGAVTGPLVMALVLAKGGGERTGFALLLIPALVALTLLAIAWRLFPRPRELAPVSKPLNNPRGLNRVFWLYLAASGLVAAGFADFPLIAYHLGKQGVVAHATIPALYALAMAVDALAALAFGRAFDRWGLGVLVASTVLSAFFAPLVFLGGPSGAVLGMVLWGVGMGAQESVLRAAVATMIEPDRRGVGYGLFNACYGAAWFLGSVVLGLLLDLSLTALVGFAVGCQLLALILLVRVARGVD